MADLLALFDNREKALLLWLVVAVLGAFSIPGVRRGVPGLVKTLLSRALAVPLLFAAGYVAGLIALMAWAGIWEASLTDVTVFWFFGPAVVAFGEAGTKAGDPALLRRILKRSVRWLLLVEFLANFYVFPLGGELVLVPVVTVLVTLAAFSEMKPEFGPAKRFLDTLVIAFGLFLLARAVVLAARNFEDFATTENMARLLLPPALTIALLPFLYVLAVYALYNSAFVRLNVLARNPNVARFGKWRMVRAFGLNRLGLSEFSGRGVVELAHAASKDEARQVIRALENAEAPRWEVRRQPH